ncbi:MAG: N-acetylmuramoyl-L-alanine amidase [Clostridiales bacterium]|nr:N-acetylmuramoyl-L-alanine amidase [Clostridiales bacterium]
MAGFFVVLCISGFFLYRGYRERQQQEWQRVVSEQESGSGAEQWQAEGAPYIDVQLLTPNEYSRPQISIEQIKYIAIHYTANPGAGAMDNRNYFENLATTHETKVSSHFVVGLEGEVVQCIPTSEMSYATNERNVDTLSIECCHADETGVFNEATYDSVVKLTAWLCTRFGLTEENVIRHYDVTGKNCPKYYVENPEAWEQMKADIAAQIQEDYILQENL